MNIAHTVIAFLLPSLHSLFLVQSFYFHFILHVLKKAKKMTHKWATTVLLGTIKALEMDFTPLCWSKLYHWSLQRGPWNSWLVFCPHTPGERWNLIHHRVRFYTVSNQFSPLQVDSTLQVLNTSPV